MRNGQTDHGTIRKINGTLNQSLTKGAATYYPSTIMILKGTREPDSILFSRFSTT